MKNGLTTIGIAAMLLLILAASSSAVAVSNVCRDIPAGSQDPGADIPISIEVTIGEDVTWYMIDEAIPSGLTVTDAGTADTSETGHLKWIVLSGATDTTHTYTVEGSAGTYNFADVTCNFQMEDMADPVSINCDTVLEIVNGGGSSESNVCRDIPSGEQNPGADILISLEVTIGEDVTWYMIDEAIPSGLTVTDAGTADTSETGHLKWIVLSGATDTTHTYTVEGSAGTYDFVGEFQMEDMADPVSINCDTELQITGEPVGQNVCRDIPSEPQSEGVNILISLEVTVDSADWYMIDEVIPSGLTVTDDGGADTTETGHLKWIVLSGATDTTYTYTVAGSAGTYNFVGEFQMESMADPATIDCDTGLEIIDNDPPTVTVTYPTSGTVSGTIDVTATATDTDGTVTQVEFFLIPDGSSIGTDTNEADGWSVSLDTTTVDNGNYQIKAVATDDEGATGDDTGGVFAIDNGFCLPLNAGWNMVSIPKKINSSSSNAAPDVFNLVDGETCCYYNGCTPEDPWSSNWDVNVVPCQGYFVCKLAPEIICVDLDTGTGAPPAQQLCKGWNLVGHPDTSEMPITTFLSAMLDDGDNVKQIWHRTSGGVWTGYPLWELTEMTPRYGYWLLMSEAGEMYGTP